jgi:hypothetical protein
MPDARLNDSAEPGDRFLRLGTPVAVLLALLSGGYTVSTTDDRIRGSEVQASLEIRDERIKALSARVDALTIEADRNRDDIKRIDTSGTAVANRGMIETLRRIDHRLDELERK